MMSAVNFRTDMFGTHYPTHVIGFDMVLSDELYAAIKTGRLQVRNLRIFQMKEV